MINLTKFKISNTQHLKINPECIHDDECEVCAKINIDYIDEEKKLCLKFGNAALSDFCYFITKSGRFQKLINNQMMLDKSVVQDPGFEWNQYFEGIIQDTEVDQYLCWSNAHKQVPPYFISWMYNDENGNIIFEITPFYPWHDARKKSHPDFITYKKFMKNYKSILKTMIPKENLQQWIIQAQELKKIYFPQFNNS